MVASSMASNLHLLWSSHSQFKCKQTFSPWNRKRIKQAGHFLSSVDQMFMGFPFVAFTDSLWRRGKPEQSNLACLHLLFPDQQAQTAGPPQPELQRCFKNPEGAADYFPYRDIQAEPPSLQNSKWAHSNYPQEKDSQEGKRNYYHTNLISDQLLQSPSLLKVSEAGSCQSRRPWATCWHLSLRTILKNRCVFPNLYLHFSAGKVHPLEHSADVDDDGLGELLTFTIWCSAEKLACSTSSREYINIEN